MNITRRDALLGATAAAVVTAPLAIKAAGVKAALASEPLVALEADLVEARAAGDKVGALYSAAHDKAGAWAFGWRTKKSDTFTPNTHEEATAWLHETDNIEIFSDVLGEPPEATAEQEKGATIYIRVPASLKVRVDRAALDQKLSSNAWAMRCLENCLSSKAAEQEKLDWLEAERPSE